jgi:AraC-like DNA-binding protein
LVHSTVPTVSVRLLWPFARLTAWTDFVIELSGCSAESFADPETRIPRSVATRLLQVAVEATGDPAIGLRAAELCEAHDFDVLEYAARSASTLGEAAECFMRFAQLMDDGLDLSLDKEGDRAIFRFHLRPRITQPPAASDFIVASALAFSRRNTATYEPPLEVQFAHPPPSYAIECARLLQAKVRFGAPCDAIVFPRSRLSAPMARANPSIANAFGQHAQKLLLEIQKADGLSGKIRRILLEALRRGPVNMNDVARSEAMAVATMRRRLRDEGTTFADLLEEVRRELALQHLRDGTLTLTEIAFLLGYSNVTSFTRAFQRWTHTTPGAYRERERNFTSMVNLQPSFSSAAR